jgi:hypothetical protein
VKEEIGVGSFGVIHRGVEKKTGATVALKFVKHLGDLTDDQRHGTGISLLAE